MLRQEILNHNFHILPEGKTVETITSEEAVTAYKNTVNLRDQMGGALHWNILNDECHMLYDVCRYHGVDDTVMNELFKELR